MAPRYVPNPSFFIIMQVVLVNPHLRIRQRLESSNQDPTHGNGCVLENRAGNNKMTNQVGRQLGPMPEVEDARLAISTAPLNANVLARPNPSININIENPVRPTLPPRGQDGQSKCPGRHGDNGLGSWLAFTTKKAYCKACIQEILSWIVRQSTLP